MDSEMKMNMRTSILNQTLRRLLLATLLSALVAGCGSGSISSTGSSLSGDTLIGGGGTGDGTGTGTGTGGGDTGTGSGSTALQNGVPATGLTASSGTELRYTIDVPAGASNLNFQLSGGSGDADLYVRYASAPTVSSYDCRPYLNSSNETCTMPSATAGTWHVLVLGYSAFSNVSLLASYTVGTGTGTGTGTGAGSGSTSVSCTGTSTGLAAEDLAGQCRAAPQATMGALEAVSG